MRILFIGDIVGDEGVDSGLALLERTLPALRREHQVDVTVANAENVSLTGPSPVGGCGMTPGALSRLWDLGIDAITGGNHSWDGPHGEELFADARVLRPLNYGDAAPGRGSLVLERDGKRLGVVNLAGRSALHHVDHPFDALDARLRTWGDDVDAVLVDFHGESVSEKQIHGWAFAGRVAAFLGTHTHAATLDARILPGGTAFVSDVGMTGPAGGMQGYDPALFVESLRTRLPSPRAGAFAAGPATLGAMLVTVEHGRAVAFERIEEPKGVAA